MMSSGSCQLSAVLVSSVSTLQRHSKLIHSLISLRRFTGDLKVLDQLVNPPILVLVTFVTSLEVIMWCHWKSFCDVTRNYYVMSLEVILWCHWKLFCDVTRNYYVMSLEVNLWHHWKFFVMSLNVLLWHHWKLLCDVIGSYFVTSQEVIFVS